MENKTINIAFPLQGQWKFFSPPGHHQYAFDFVVVKNNKMHEENFFKSMLGSHEKNNIVETIRRWYQATFKFKPEEKDGFVDIRPNVGNFVMIQSEEGFIVFMAHLKCSSLNVSKGQHVQVGELVGEVGNSGNSTAPHLHLNLFDQMDRPIEANVLPFVFNEYQELTSDGVWLNCIDSTPKLKSIVRNLEPSNM